MSTAKPDDGSVHNGGDRAAAEGMPVEGGVAALRERLVYVVGPLEIGAEDRDVGWAPDCQRAAIEVQHARGSGGEQRHQAGQRDLAGVHQMFERQAQAPFRGR